MADNSTLDEFVISIKLKTDGLEQSVTRLTKIFDNLAVNVKGKMDEAFKPNHLKQNMEKNIDIIKLSALRISKILTGGLGTLGSFLGAKFAIDFIKNMTANAHGTEMLSKAFNVKPQQLQLLQEIYKRAGGAGGAGEANQAVGQLYQRLTSGTPDNNLAAAFHQLGIKISPGNINPVQIITQALASLSSGKFNAVQRGNLVQKLGLGSSALSIANSPGDLQKFTSEAQKDLVSDKSIKDMAELDRRFQDVGERWNKIQNVMLTKILPVIEQATKGFEMLLGIDSRATMKGYANNFKNKFGAKAVDKTIADWAAHNVKKGPGFGADIKNAWNVFKNAIGMAETSGGNPKQIAKAEAQGAYGVYGLRLSTAKDQLRSEAHYKKNSALYKAADKLTENDLRANNNALAHQISARYLNRLSKAYGPEEAIKRYHGSTNQNENQAYLNNVLKYQLHPLQPSTHSSSSVNNHNVAYNMGDINMHGIKDPQGFAAQLHTASNTAFTFAGNVLA